MAERIRHLTKAQIDRDDKATIVSIYPNKITERKHTIFPGLFIIEPGAVLKPSILVVGQSTWELPMFQENRAIQMPLNAIRVAESVVNDYVKSVFAYAEDAAPGLFFIKGAHDSQAILKNNVKEIQIAGQKQKNWYEKLVKSADVQWARTNGSPLAISNDARLAAQELGIGEGKAWMQDFNTLQLTNCPACGTLRNGNFPICNTCRTIIDVKRYKELGLSVAS